MAITLTSAELVVIRARLKEAESAYHLLQIGRSARVVVDQNGERVEFTATNRATLYSYILELRNMLPSEGGSCFPNSSGPATFIF